MSTDLTNASDGFELLHPRIQEQLYHMTWRDLREIQSKAIKHILQESGHLVISAPTARGKTEAAFLPILSRIVDQCDIGVRVVYISPLKALINDQFRRLEELCERSQIPVHKWHGDVSATAKRTLREHPSGILLITPESIESLFINYADRLDAMFSCLAFVVIDELHSFLATERGAHLRSLLSRMLRRSRLPVRLVALSATFGKGPGLDTACEWLRFGNDERIPVIEDRHDRRRRYEVRGYLRPVKVKSVPIAVLSAAPAASDSEPVEADPRMVNDLFQIFSATTALVFGNSKSRLEFYADILSRHTERIGIRNPFRVHHGSLSKPEREETEEALRSNLPTVAFCSSTLEMGIDVGNVKLIGQIGPPWGVSSLTQRMGRSGRGENEAAELRMFIEEDEPGPQSDLLHRLLPALLQSVAMSDLLIGYWSEPPQADRLHASTLVQQILSVIAEHGGARADHLFDLLARHGAFQNVDEPLFRQILGDMAVADLIEGTSQSDFILGLQGEKIVRSKEFYTAFLTPEEFSVLHDGRRIGSVAMFPATNTDQFLILAGRRWRVLEINTERRVILVVPAKGGRLPVFRVSGGPDIHPRVREKMRTILFDEEVPVYLDATAKTMLASARQEARTAKLAKQSFRLEGRELLWFTWTGTRIQRTLLTFLREVTGARVEDEGIALAFDGLGENDVRCALRDFVQKTPTSEALAASVPNKSLEKYEPFLSDELQAVVFGRNCLDVEGARCLLVELGFGA
jgi:ATP-dependent helicase Lhr and Lhr-like helicase